MTHPEKKTDYWNPELLPWLFPPVDDEKAPTSKVAEGPGIAESPSSRVPVRCQ